jgi:hypothetical protein
VAGAAREEAELMGVVRRIMAMHVPAGLLMCLAIVMAVAMLGNLERDKRAIAIAFRSRKYKGSMGGDHRKRCKGKSGGGHCYAQRRNNPADKGPGPTEEQGECLAEHQEGVCHHVPALSLHGCRRVCRRHVMLSG